MQLSAPAWPWDPSATAAPSRTPIHTAVTATPTLSPSAPYVSAPLPPLLPPAPNLLPCRAPSRILWRTVRGMIPHKTPRGAAALERMKSFEGIPAPYDKVGGWVCLQLGCAWVRTMRLCSQCVCEYCCACAGVLGWRAGFQSRLVAPAPPTFSLAALPARCYSWLTALPCSAAFPPPRR